MIVEAVKHALDVSIEKVAKNEGVDRGAALKIASERAANFSAQWFSGGEPTLNYNEPLTRWTYCFAQVPANANLISDMIFHYATVDEGFRKVILQKKHLTFTAIGGGPGTEMLGIAKFYKTHGKLGECKEVDLRVIDQEVGWQENLVNLKEGLRSELKRIYKEPKNYPFLLSHIFSRVNTGDTESFANYADVISANVVICSYFLSEVYDLNKLNALIGAMKAAAEEKPYYLLIVDRNESNVKNKMLDFANLLGGVVLHEKSNDSRLDNDEQISVLQEYVDSIGRKPRITWNATSLLIKVG